MKPARSTRLLLSLLLILLALAPRSTQAAGPLTTCTITDLGPLPGGTFSEAFAINASGQVVGDAGTQDASGNVVTQHAVRWDAAATTPTDLGTSPGITSSYAIDINASGAVVGWSDGAVEWASGTTTPTTLGLLPGSTFSHALAINASGQVVGEDDIKDANGNTVAHAVRWDAGTTTPTDLGTLSVSGITTSTVAWGINASGQVVGAAGALPDGTIWGHAVLWNAGMTTPTDLGSLLPSGSGWVLEIAYAINDAGQIVGVGYINNGPDHGFRLSCS
jgi:probable HAF family extracellular repeat protein